MTLEYLNVLRQLDYKKQLVFAYLTCKRLYPNYVFFSKQFSFGDPMLIEKAIYDIYEAIFDIEIQDPSALISKIDQNTPAPEKFGTVLASSALDACSVVTETISFISDKKFKRIEDISTLGTDSVDMYIQEKFDLDYNQADFEDIIKNNLLMKNEIHNQTGIISYLANISDIQESDIATLVELQTDKGNLEL
jgi:uncharacterized protein YjaG (DUF416 family)